MPENGMLLSNMSAALLLRFPPSSEGCLPLYGIFCDPLQAQRTDKNSSRVGKFNKSRINLFFRLCSSMAAVLAGGRHPNSSVIGLRDYYSGRCWAKPLG
jgi:hypothetical protein